MRRLRFDGESPVAHRVLSAASSVALAAIFLYAGLDKAFHYVGFLRALGSYAFVPDVAVEWVAPVVILAELWVGIGLLRRSWRRAAAITAAVLMVVFTAAVATNELVAPGTLCGCWFTFTLAESTGPHILQNLVFLGLALTIWWRERTDAQHGSLPEGPTAAAPAAR